MTGVLYARVGGAWVPLATQANPPISLTPAYVGPRKDGSATTAQFGHTSLAGKHGYTINDVGFTSLFARDGTKIQFVGTNAAGTSEAWWGDISLNRFQLSDWVMGQHPSIGLLALWFNSRPAAADYVLAGVAGSYSILNGGVQTDLRVGNTTYLMCSAGTYISQCRFLAQVYPRFDPPSESWVHAQSLAASTGTASYHARYALFSAYAPQFRAAATVGERIQCITESGGNFTPIAASAFETNSALASKQQVRSLRPARERIVVHHDPLIDTVPEPDIMALRPVTFMPRNTESVRYDGEDLVRSVDPPDSIFGIQTRRERLGLIADEVQHVIPSAVNRDIDGNPLGIDYAQITVALLDHVQRLTEEIATLRYRVAELEGQP